MECDEARAVIGRLPALRLKHVQAQFAFAALVPWTLFSQSLTVAAESIVRDMNLVSKVYIPRLIIPLAAIGVLIVDFVIAFGFLLLLMALYSWPPGFAALAWVPATTLLALAVSLGVGVWLSALMVLYRDVRWVPMLQSIAWSPCHMSNRESGTV